MTFMTKMAISLQTVVLVINRNSVMIGQISFKLGMIVDLPTGHMHVDLFYDLIQNGRLAAIFDFWPGTNDL